MYIEGYTSDLNTLIQRMTEFGLGPQEAHLYCHLISVKSATVPELMARKEFAKIQRPNLYKLITSLKEKNAILEEQKGEIKRIFPVEPAIFFQSYLDTEKQRIEQLESDISTLNNQFEVLAETPNPDFYQIPTEYKELYQKIIPSAWVIKEMPIIQNLKQLGNHLIVEFDTHRKFSGNAAGLSIHKFNYAEHIPAAFPKVSEFQCQKLKDALEMYRTTDFFRFKDVNFMERLYQFKTQSPKIPSLNYFDILIKSTVGIQFHAAMAIFCLTEYPLLILSLWTADQRDLTVCMQKCVENFNIFQPQKN